MFDLLAHFPSLLLRRLCAGTHYSAVDIVGGLFVAVICSFAGTLQARLSLLVCYCRVSLEVCFFRLLLRLFLSVSFSLFFGLFTPSVVIRFYRLVCFFRSGIVWSVCGVVPFTTSFVSCIYNVSEAGIP